MKVQRDAQSLLLLCGSIGKFFFGLGRTNQGAGGQDLQISYKTPQIRSTKEFQENQTPPHQESLVTQNLAKPRTVGKQRAKPQTQARLEYLPGRRSKRKLHCFQQPATNFSFKPESNNDISAEKEGSKNKSRTRQARTDLTEDSDHPKTMQGGTT